MQAASKIKTMWRNSACLMLFSGNFKYRNPPLDGFLEQNTLPNLLESTAVESAGENELLFVLRHAKSGFMASTHVFPGGVLDEADFSPQWLHVFGDLQHHTNMNPFASILNLKDSSAPRLPLYSTVPGDVDSLPGEIAFRICAIRELFEEAGVMLARDIASIKTVLELLPGSFKPTVKFLSASIREQWRERVHSNAREFTTMCRELQCFPDVWSLIEWSDWLTPRNSRRRYDTVFYMCFVETKPSASPDGTEVKSATWISPEKASQLFLSQEILLAPPQFAELKTLEGFADVRCLHSYALSEMMSGGSSYRRLSARMATKDDLVLSVRECDDLYPIEGSEDWITEVQHPKSISLRDKVPLVLSQNRAFEYVIPSHTAQELEVLSQSLCRMEFHAPFEIRFLDNQAANKIADYHKRFGHQLLQEKHMLSKL